MNNQVACASDKQEPYIGRLCNRIAGREADIFNAGNRIEAIVDRLTGHAPNQDVAKERGQDSSCELERIDMAMDSLTGAISYLDRIVSRLEEVNLA